MSDFTIKTFLIIAILLSLVSFVTFLVVISNLAEMDAKVSNLEIRLDTHCHIGIYGRPR